MAGQVGRSGGSCLRNTCRSKPVIGDLRIVYVQAKWGEHWGDKRSTSVRKANWI